MEQNNNKTANNGIKQPNIDNNGINLSDVSHPDYNPAKDPEVEPDWEDVKNKLEYIKNKLWPYQKYIMIVGILMLIMIVVFLGYAYGGMKVCSELDGILDDKFKCHPYILNQTQKIYLYGVEPLWVIPNITIEE